MLNLVKNFLASDTWRPSRKSPFIDHGILARMHTGSVVSFGPMPHYVLNHKKLTVTAVNTYRFAESRYVSYELSLEQDTKLYLIVAEAEGEQYLAISRKISSQEEEKLFQGQNISDFTKKPARAELRCKQSVKGFRGWTELIYHKALDGMAGVLYPGNFMGKALPENGAAQEFDYFLFASDGEEHAIEIEKYKNGRVEIYATIYRPVSDITGITIPRKPRLVVQHKPSAPEFGMELSHAMQAQVPVLSPLAAIVENMASLPAIHAPEPNLPINIIGCDIKIAGRIIDEAVKNGITFSQLVRKVVGLPVELKEEVFFSLPLSDSDYKTLAARYHLPAENREAIHARIMEEIKDFSGIR